MDFLISFKCNLLNFKATFCRGAGFDISCEISTYVSGYCASYVRMFYYAKLLYAMLHYVMLCYVMLCFLCVILYLAALYMHLLKLCLKYFIKKLYIFFHFKVAENSFQYFSRLRV